MKDEDEKIQNCISKVYQEILLKIPFAFTSVRFATIQLNNFSRRETIFLNPFTL